MVVITGASETAALRQCQVTSVWVVGTVSTRTPE